MANVKCVGEGWTSGINRINNSDKKKDKQINIRTSDCIRTSMTSPELAQMAVSVPPPEEGTVDP